MYTKFFLGLLSLSAFAQGAIYQGSGAYEGREIKVWGELNIPKYLTSEAPVVKASEEKEDHYHSDLITYYCSTSVSFPGATLFLDISDAKTGQQLMFIDEEEASLTATAYERFSEKVDCKEVDFSKTKVALIFSAKVAYHLPIAKKDGYEVSIALYPLLGSRAEMTFDKKGDRYLLNADEFESRLEKEITLPILHWGAYSQKVGSIPLTLRAD